MLMLFVTAVLDVLIVIKVVIVIRISCNRGFLSYFLHIRLPPCLSCRYMGIGLSAQGVNMNRLPGKMTFSYDDLKADFALPRHVACWDYVKCF